MNDLFLTRDEWLNLQPGDVLIPFWDVTLRYEVAFVSEYAHEVSFTNGAASRYYGGFIPEARLQAFAEAAA